MASRKALVFALLEFSSCLPAVTRTSAWEFTCAEDATEFLGRTWHCNLSVPRHDSQLNMTSELADLQVAKLALAKWLWPFRYSVSITETVQRLEEPGLCWRLFWRSEATTVITSTSRQVGRRRLPYGAYYCRIICRQIFSWSCVFQRASSRHQSFIWLLHLCIRYYTNSASWGNHNSVWLSLTVLTIYRLVTVHISRTFLEGGYREIWIWFEEVLANEQPSDNSKE